MRNATLVRIPRAWESVMKVDVFAEVQYPHHLSQLAQLIWQICKSKRRITEYWPKLHGPYVSLPSHFVYDACY